MSKPNITIGSKVVFKDKVFSPPYTPYFDAYEGHTFEVTGYLIDEGREVFDHLGLKCLTDPKVHVNGYVHDDELKVV